MLTIKYPLLQGMYILTTGYAATYLGISIYAYYIGYVYF